MTVQYNRTATREAQSFVIGDRVLVHNVHGKSAEAVVCDQSKALRACLVEFHNGARSYRNRKFLTLLPRLPANKDGKTCQTGTWTKRRPSTATADRGTAEGARIEAVRTKLSPRSSLSTWALETRKPRTCWSPARPAIQCYPHQLGMTSSSRWKGSSDESNEYGHGAGTTASSRPTTRPCVRSDSRITVGAAKRRSAATAIAQREKKAVTTSLKQRKCEKPIA